MIDDLLFVSCLTRLKDDKGLDLFTMDRILYTNHCRLGYLAKSVNHLFDLAGRNVFTGLDNDILLTLGNKKVSIFILMTDITGV